MIKWTTFWHGLVVAALVAGATSAQGAKRQVVGYFWVPENDTSPYWTLADYANALTAIAPTWLAFEKDGTFTNTADARTLRFAKSRGLQVTPLVANHPMRPETARPIFADAEAATKNVALLLKTVSDLGADGINVDIEGVAPADRPLYNSFIEALCKAFHRRGLVVTAAIPAKTADNPTGAWAGFADYAFLARHLDQVQLMCYDEHWSGGEAGPIASLPWVRKVMEYATSVMPREKIVMGIPFYGYDWPETGAASEVTPLKGEQLSDATGNAPRWEDVAKTASIAYMDDAGARRTAYFETARSLGERLKLAREFKVAGVAIWRLGDETPGFWPPLKRYRDGS
jgi:spore germination protein YaaH